MSSKIFKPGSFRREQKGAKYKRGQPSLELDLASRVAELYLGGRLTEGYDGGKPRSSFNRSLEIISDSLEGCEVGGLDHFLFLEMVIQRISQTSEHTKHTHCLIDPLLQVLYLKGLNNFSIDLFPLPLWPVYCGSFLTGKKGNPLTASYLGEDVGQFAYDSKDCVLSLKADALNVGHKSTSVVVKFDGASGSVGWRGEGCDYEFLDEFVVINPYENHDCTFRVRSDTAYDGDLKYLNELGFFRRGNRILVPDGRGGWDEVVPK